MDKQFMQFMMFLSSIKSGKKAIILARDYVMLDRQSYEKLTQREENVAVITCYEEAGKIDKTSWKKLSGVK